MNKYSISTLALGFIAMTALTGCFDDNYDLANIDTESEFKVNNLTIPINLDPIKLDEIIDLKDNSKIKIVDGNYAVVVDGDYKSDPVHFNTFTAKAPTLTDETVEIPGNHLPQIKKSFTYEANDIDNAIHGIDYLGVKPMQFLITFNSDGEGDFTLQDLKIQMPSGLTAKAIVGNYDPATGLLSVPSVTSQGAVARVGLDISGITFTGSNSQFNYNSHYAKFFENVDVLSGTVQPTSSAGIGTIRAAYKLGNIDVETFSGDIQYDWKKFNMDNIDLTDIPALLNQDGTDLILNNPQLYMSFTNPLEQYGAWGQLGFELVAMRAGEADKTFSPDNDNFTVGKDSRSDIYNFCLAPQMPSELYTGYQNAKFEKFTSLSNVLSGNGLPSKVGVNVTDSEYPLQKISNLPLGGNLGVITGHYTFFAPLNLKEGSVIVYRHTEDGWNDDEIDKITIQSMDVTALITNQLPYAIHFTGYPVDKYGKQIGNVVIEGTEVPANAVDYPVTLHATGVITHLDGLTFTAYGYPQDSDKPLYPQQQIIINKLRAKVSGNYIREL